MTHFSGDIEVEQKVKDDLGVTVRCIPLGDGEPGTCPFTGKPSAKRVVWAKSY
jgi:prolyl-tRNA synthetase